MYHVLPEVTGIGTVWLGWLIARRRGMWQGLCALVLLGGCEFLIEFSSDARGYAPAGFFALLCWWMLEDQIARPRRWKMALTSAAAVMGCLSHLTFVVVLAGLIGMSVVAVKRRVSWGSAIAQTLLWWSVPVAALITLYFVDIRDMVRGGGPPTPDDLASQAAAMVLGLPFDSLLAGVAGVIVLFLCAIQLRRIYRAADPVWVLGVVCFLFVPAVLLFVPRTEYLHPRYIYVAVPVMLIVLGMEIGRYPRAVPIAFLVAFCGFNAVRLGPFLRLGRGDYAGAVRFMVVNTKTAKSELIVGVHDTHPSSNPTLMVAEYYLEYHEPGVRKLVMWTIQGDYWRDQWPQWMIAEGEPGPVIAIENGESFNLAATFPKGAVASGIPWTVYESRWGRADVRLEEMRRVSP
jgi:hypothetical protein